MEKLIVSPSPHILSRNTTSKIMLNVVIAMLPALIVSAIFFGIRTLAVTAISVASCVIFEYLIRKIMKKESTISDLSAVVTGVLLAFNLPPSIPLWIPVIGAFFAIVIAKQMFGGIGQNFANPTIVARIILFVSFPTYMTTWTLPTTVKNTTDAIASATPLVDLANANTMDLFIGNVSGCIGEISAAALIIGGIYLVVTKVINPFVPIAFIGTVFVFTWILGENPVNQILAGGLMLGAIFMATDYATTPATLKGKIIFAVGCGIITVAIRVYGSYPEGVSFAILFMNLITPLIDRCTKSKPFGALPKPKKEGK